MINVLIIHDERLYYEGNKAIGDATDDIRIVGMAATSGAFTEQMDKQPIDVAVVHMHLSSMNGIELLTRFKDDYPETNFVLLTHYSDKELVVAGVLSGSKGFLLTNEPVKSLIEGIRNATNGEYVFSGAAGRILAEKIVHYAYSPKEILRKRLTNRHQHLTERGLDVAQLLTKRMTNREIAHALNLSEGTVKNYVSEIYSTLQFSNRNELIAYLKDLSVVREKDTLIPFAK